MRYLYLQLFFQILLITIVHAEPAAEKFNEARETKFTNYIESKKSRAGIIPATIINFDSNVSSESENNTQQEFIKNLKDSKVQYQLLNKGKTIVILNDASNQPSQMDTLIESDANIKIDTNSTIKLRNVTVNDPYYSSAQWNLQAVNASQAWSKAMSSNYRLITVDTGIAYNHQDLNYNYAGGRNYINGSYDPIDGNGHGTHIAGIARSNINNSNGIAGIVKAPVYAYKVLNDQGSGQLLDASYALDDIRQYAPSGSVVNMSMGTTGQFISSWFNSMQMSDSKNILFVAASGNDGIDIGQTYDSPGSFQLPNLITVGNLNQQLKPESSSNYSNRVVHIYAPGTNILAPVPQNVSGNTVIGSGNNKYAALTGTSMSAPLVAGTALLFKQLHPLATPRAIKCAIMATATKIPELASKSLSGGYLNAGELLTRPFDAHAVNLSMSLAYQGFTPGPSAREPHCTLLSSNTNNNEYTVQVNIKPGEIQRYVHNMNTSSVTPPFLKRRLWENRDLNNFLTYSRLVIFYSAWRPNTWQETTYWPNTNQPKYENIIFYENTNNNYRYLLRNSSLNTSNQLTWRSNRYFARKTTDSSEFTQRLETISYTGGIPIYRSDLRYTEYGINWSKNIYNYYPSSQVVKNMTTETFLSSNGKLYKKDYLSNFSNGNKELEIFTTYWSDLPVGQDVRQSEKVVRYSSANGSIIFDCLRNYDRQGNFISQSGLCS